MIISDKVGPENPSRAAEVEELVAVGEVVDAEYNCAVAVEVVLVWGLLLVLGLWPRTNEAEGLLGVEDLSKTISLLRMVLGLYSYEE